MNQSVLAPDFHPHAQLSISCLHSRACSHHTAAEEAKAGGYYSLPSRATTNALPSCGTASWTGKRGFSMLDLEDTGDRDRQRVKQGEDTDCELVLTESKGPGEF